MWIVSSQESESRFLALCVLGSIVHPGHCGCSFVESLDLVALLQILVFAF